MRDSSSSQGTDGGGDTTLSNFEKVTLALTTDPRCLKEASLGKRVGYYRMHGELGSGNFSEVKLAVHSLLREKVAVKILDKTKLDQKTKRLLSREISSMERLRHPNIVRLYEVVETLAKLHMIMEYAHGGELYTKITTEGRLPEGEAKAVFIQVSSALQHMHENDIIHRDLKAENVFYAGPRVIKVGDFGFSTSSTMGNPLNTFCGSPPYAAPELFQDDFYEGRFVDVWALGVLLYFIVTGLMPFRAETVGKLKKCILAGNFQVPPFVPKQCQETILGILKRDPKERLLLESILQSDWLDGQDLAEPLAKFEKDPLKAFAAASSRGGGNLGEDEKQAISTLIRHGVTSDVVRAELGNHGSPTSSNRPSSDAVKSHITGMYRITVHKVQKRAVADALARSKGGSSKSLAGSSFNSSGHHTRQGMNGGISVMSNGTGTSKQSRLCTIL